MQRDESIQVLATKIVDVMRQHANRAEAIDAHDMAKIMFRRPSANRDPIYSESQTEFPEVRN